MLVKKVFLILLFLGCSFLFSIDLKITVYDRDLDFPLEGVRVREAASGKEVYSDALGNCLLELEDGISRVVIIAELIGYEPRKQLVTDFSQTLNIYLLMEGVLEGQELVVEAEAIGETDEEVGVSTVIEQETIESAAKMGIIEDVMTAVKILPGISYSGGFYSGISVRGGDPSGLTAVMDGFVTNYPNHWGGSISIFNPNIVESIKFSPGIFSSKYGQATSALLEINSVDPTDGLKFREVISSSTYESFAQVPFGKDEQLGILAGLRLTNYTLALELVKIAGEMTGSDELTDTVRNISLAPYIYDGYFKTMYAPSETFKWYINGFWGNDGVGIRNFETGDPEVEISNGFNFYYTNTDLFINTGVQMMFKDNLLMKFTAGYEFWDIMDDGEITENGYHSYSDEFKTLYGSLITGGAEGYEIYTESNFEEHSIKQSVQARVDSDLSLGNSALIQLGVGSNCDISSSSSEGTIWQIFIKKDSGDPYYKEGDFSTTIDGDTTFSSFVYFNMNYIIIPDLLESDLGVRSDHSYLIKKSLTLNTYPDISPRFNLKFSPEFGNRVFSDNVFSIGTGIFSKNPFTVWGVRDEFGLKDFELKSEKSFTSVLGWQTSLPYENRFKIEGYYKYVYDRFYINSLYDENENAVYIPHFNGYGHIGGGDLLLERKLSTHFDGLISYTFVYGKYMDPEDDSELSEYTPYETVTPRREYYFPSFHRFHTVNMLLNYKPTDNFTFTTKLSFASGVPKNRAGETIMFYAYLEDVDGNTQLAEMYSRSTYYSNSLRTNYSLPLDLKATWHNYYKNSKWEWEFYIAAQDVLSPLLAAIQSDDSAATSKWDGDDTQSSGGSFSFPIVSVGYSMNF